MKRTTITIHEETLQSMLYSMQSLTGVIGHELTWDEYLGQMILLAELHHRQPVQAKGLKKYVWGAECPVCHQNNTPLSSKRSIIWRIKCQCGHEFIAVA